MEYYDFVHNRDRKRFEGYFEFLFCFTILEVKLIDFRHL